MAERGFRNVLSALVVGTGLVASGWAQAGGDIETVWSKYFGNEKLDQVNSIVPTTDGGYVFTGCQESVTTGKNQMLLVKLNQDGVEQWSKIYGAPDKDVVGYAVEESPAGGYILAGYSRLTAAGNDDAIIMKTSANGTTEWMRTENGLADERAYSVAATADGGFVMTGWTMSSGAGSADAFLVKYSAAGNRQWTRSFGTAGWDAAFKVTIDADQGLLLVGETMARSATNAMDIFVIKTNANGSELWRKSYGAEADESGYSIEPCTAGGYIIAGRTFSAGGYGEDDGVIFRITPTGDILWQKRFGGACSDVIYSVKEDTDHGFLLSGCTQSFGTANNNVYLIKISEAGETLWRQITPGSVSIGSAFRNTTDNGFIVALNVPTNGGDVKVVKLRHGTPIPEYATGLYETFTCIDSLGQIGFGGFKKPYWNLDVFTGQMYSVAPGNGAKSKILSRPFTMSRDTGYVSAKWNVGFPTEYGFNWSAHNQFEVALCDAAGAELYTVQFKPNRPNDIGTTYDLKLFKNETQVLATARTDRVTPHGKGAPMVAFEMIISKTGSIKVSYDAADGLGLLTYIDTPDAAHRMFGKMKVMYKTGTVGDGANYVTVDNLNVTEHKE